MYTIIMLFLGALLLLINTGCSGLLIHQAIRAGDQLSPEQVKAMNDVGLDVWSCGTVSGPPPSGAFTWITIPKGKGVVVFGEGCRLR